jgi:ubiquinol-cytochrome c reductase iron-sulfur subunit
MSKDDIDHERRRFLVAATSVVGGVGAAFATVPFLSSWWPTAKAQAAGAPVEADISKLEYGQQITIEWRGKPVFVIRRTQEVLDQLAKHEAKLRDPKSVAGQQPKYAQNKTRALNPEYLVLVGICTHLGCSPKYMPTLGQLGKGWPGGFYCPCHGSTFDLAGRVFQGVPAPLNLQVPPYTFADKHTLIVGVDDQSAMSA